MVPDFGNLKSDIGLAKLNEHLLENAFVGGFSLSQDDVATLHKLLGAPNCQKYPNACRWYKHISSYAPGEQALWKGKKPTADKPKDDDDEIDLFGDDDGDVAAKAKELAEKKKAEAAPKKKKVVIDKSTLVIEVKPMSDKTDLDLVEKLCREITIDGLLWGQKAKKVPIAYGLHKLQIGCVIEDAKIPNTDDILEKIEVLGLSEEEAKKRIAKRDCGEQDEEDGAAEDEDDDGPGLVQSAEVVSFNKV
eukprot:GHVU01104836.1.p1 GENE.GHVU01104836.1~~GHVU01104836.1.p1  ORF type:complete len:248 (+),score=86.86 GHVU01104836.1:191-934(+)